MYDQRDRAVRFAHGEKITLQKSEKRKNHPNRMIINLNTSENHSKASEDHSKKSENHSKRVTFT